MPPTHKQTFWTIDAGTGDIGAAKRAQIAKAALILQQHPIIVHSSFAGGYSNAEKPEIALTLNSNFTEIDFLKGEVKSALAREGLPNVTVTLEGNVYWFTFDNTHLEALKASVIKDLPLARKSIDELVCIPIPKPTHQIPTNLATELAAILSQFSAHSLLGAQLGGGVRVGHGVDTTNLTDIVKASRGTNASNVPSSDLTETMLIGEAKYKRMRDARDGKVENEVNSLKNALVEISTTTKTNTAVVIMIASGIIAVGAKMVSVYEAISAAGSLSIAISSAIGAIGGVAVLAGIVAAIAAVLLALFIFSKDAVNELVLVNGLEKKVNFTKDWIIDGERFKITLEVPDAEKSSKKPYAYGCGIYAYRKTRWFGQPVGFFGSNAGVAFKPSDGTEFSVGVDCPNTALGGTNCIRVRSGSGAESAAISAASSGYSTELIKVNGHSCIASRASSWGSINYGICSIE